MIAPVPYHIELVGALLIHPKFTNHAPPSGDVDIASHSITFLRNVLAILGPINANLGEAFSFGRDNGLRTSRRSRITLEYDESSSDSEPTVANVVRLQECATDFWRVAGWAFNCSAKYPKRWKYWKVWLDYMLDVLDADWLERERQDGEAGAALDTGSLDGEDEHKMRRQSLLVSYLSQAATSSSTMKRVVRSAFADGGKESLLEFKPVFENETKVVKHQNGQKRKRDGPVDRVIGDYGDIGEEVDVTYDSSGSTPEHAQDDDDEAGLRSDASLGGMESIMLRQRVITLVRNAIYRHARFILRYSSYRE